MVRAWRQGRDAPDRASTPDRGLTKVVQSPRCSKYFSLLRTGHSCPIVSVNPTLQALKARKQCATRNSVTRPPHRLSSGRNTVIPVSSETGFEAANAWLKPHAERLLGEAIPRESLFLRRGQSCVTTALPGASTGS